jgi:hypothetical protein
VLYFYTSGFDHAAMKYDPNYRFFCVEKPSVYIWIGNQPGIFKNAIGLFGSSLAFFLS